MCVILDKGPAPSMAKIKLQFLVVSDGKRSADTYVVDVERTWTVAKWCVGDTQGGSHTEHTEEASEWPR